MLTDVPIIGLIRNGLNHCLSVISRRRAIGHMRLNCIHVLLLRANVHTIDMFRGDVLVEDWSRLLLRWQLYCITLALLDLLKVLRDILILRLDLVGDPWPIPANRRAHPVDILSCRVAELLSMIA